MIWPVWIAVNLAAIAATWRCDPRPAILSLAGLVAMRFMGALSLPFDLIARAFVWFAIGYCVAFVYLKFTAGGLIVASGLCYLLARVSGAEMAFLSLPFVVSDLLWLASVFVIVMGPHEGTAYRGNTLGGFNRLDRHKGYFGGNTETPR